MSEDKKQWAVIVNVVGWQSMYRPFVCEMQKDCPKTLFTKMKNGYTRRWHKDDIRYQIFDSEAKAKSAIGQVAQHRIHEHKQDLDRVDKSKELADNGVKTAVQLSGWKGGRS